MPRVKGQAAAKPLSTHMRQVLVNAQDDGTVIGHPNTLNALLISGLVRDIDWDYNNQYTATLTERGQSERQRLLAATEASNPPAPKPHLSTGSCDDDPVAHWS